MPAPYEPLSTKDEEDLPSPIYSSQSSTSSTRQSYVLPITALVVALVLGGGLIAFFCLRRQQIPQDIPIPTLLQNNLFFDPWNYVKGRPTTQFRDNLLNGTQYITSWVSAGWTNDVMTYANLIYLSIITQRVPIIPPFAPSHVGIEAGYIDFSAVFDLDRLSRELKIPILEWKHVKDNTGDKWDSIGCWSTNMMTMSTNPNVEKPEPRNTIVPQFLRVDPSYTPLPTYAKLLPDVPGESHVSFQGLASVGYPEERFENLVPEDEIYPSPQLATRLPPDEHLLCYDFLYFVSLLDTYEWNKDYSVGWNIVGSQLHWSPRLTGLANAYLRRALIPGMHSMTLEETEASTEEVPPYIGLHIRRADFGGWCDKPLQECFAPLSAYHTRVTEIQNALRERDGIEVTHVLVTSDESDDAWWDQVRALGWKFVDHKQDRTAELFGGWYPTLLDAVFQSFGVGFVGTDMSTMSLLARKRVKAWQNGIGVDVKWGTKDADAH